MSEVIGWRGWNVRTDQDGPVLESPYRNTRWLGPTMAADRKPRRWNYSGIYAVVDENSEEMSPWCWDVYGEVALFGRVVVGERGYRAERAVVRSLYISPSYQSYQSAPHLDYLMAQLGARYQVDVKIGTRRGVWPAMGVLRLLDEAGQVLDSAPWLRRPVKFGPSREAYTAAGTRLDLPTGACIGWFLQPIFVPSGGVTTVMANITHLPS